MDDLVRRYKINMVTPCFTQEELVNINYIENIIKYAEIINIGENDKEYYFYNNQIIFYTVLINIPNKYHEICIAYKNCIKNNDEDELTCVMNSYKKLIKFFIKKYHIKELYIYDKFDRIYTVRNYYFINDINEKLKKHLLG